MKISVGRRLSGGTYLIGFAVSDFSADERTSMEKFGVPMITMYRLIAGRYFEQSVAITALGTEATIGFPTAEEANKYEEKVMTQVREKLEALRQRKDDFTSTKEIEI